ncbi:uncharacterized protein PHALS_03554 [Plasmopara halstedii]|uniref:Uncharacterized protein n=1 Tax=Plasmopara halstedii TaxID=4781 RepID=A0A0P1AYQ8_PLAHL|nr:uncharacterized protein PHALS_03554 [Plasmopara halstedii]CEG46880.1 hypothetical protein PHALS_03554 [Plasmopara halstedii]|eukprot:XP_024583249.1 hypothetical protein PHALS_03554 [Plasmopara halstedii]
MVASNILCRGFGFHGTNPSEAVQHTTVQFFNFITSPAAGSATSTSVGAIVSYTFGDEAC